VNADTRTTVGYLRESLSMLPSLVAKLNNDIKLDLTTNIFKAYATIQDKDLVCPVML
jgi:hypothetical protein